MRDDDIEVLTSYSNAAEAGFAQQLLEEVGIRARLGSEASATWLSYYGSAVGGVRLLVRHEDLQTAARVLQDSDPSPDAFEWPEVHDEEEEGEAPGSEPAASKPSPMLVRAYRIAIVGAALATLGVPLYSLYLIVRHRLYLPDRGGNNWRFHVAMLANTGGVIFAVIYWSWWLQ